MSRAARLCVALCALIWLTPLAARAVPECGGEQDTCSCGRSNYCLCDGTCGNCVWHAWHMACCSWGRALEWCTDAGTWDEYATSNGYPTGDDPHDASVFVCNPSGTCSDWGHVGWVVSAYPDGSFDSTEQYWGGPCGTYDKHRVAGFATGGFIYNPDQPDVDDAAFVAETIPDGTHFAPGENFVKRWTMRNSGNSSWTRDGNYLWTRDGEESFGAAEQTLLPAGATVAPGQTHDWDVPMTAPSAPGTYRGYFRMDNYGVGRFGDRVWVEIIVDDLPPEDAGVDAGVDAGADSQADAGVDAGVDAGATDSAWDGGDPARTDENGAETGCRCSTHRPTPAGFLLMLIAGLLAVGSSRRRKRSRTRPANYTVVE
ncbi:MAG TPA: NBR1-Ig-like domain-containing protein [Myxococcota bacterium]|nr:NBR1-Ig-like domain-containing protein [Myxococcota bacterium]